MPSPRPEEMAIDQHQLPKLFLTYLEPGLVMDMVVPFDDALSYQLHMGLRLLEPPFPEMHTLSLDDSAQNVVREYMAALPTVPRFESVRLFLSRPEKEAVQKFCS